ncbi:transporter [Amycolatopsis sp. K13G38]|uniref:Transporter n=1 Tax=Amycolatopsis acididurans TaxID=2724524 RepID=A0ABX1J1N9_9PSEU|nr:transporter [Amycolatopsis acididurans]NKQ53697.1 transporter [Amycolatopsis acididurans]
MERFLLVLVVVAVFALALWGMRLGWRRRARSQSVRLAPFPQVPAEPGEPLLEADGLYVSTTTAGNWQDRIVTRGMGLRGRAVLRRYAGGVEVDRAGAPGFWIPDESVLRVRRGSAIAGKVMGSDSLLIITWRLGEVELDTGFRGDDHGDYPQWMQSLSKGHADSTESRPK